MHGLFGFEEFCGTAKYRKLAEKAVFVQVAILNGDNEHSVHGRDFQIERSIGRVAGRQGAVDNLNWPGNFSAALLICQRFPQGGEVRRHFGRTEQSSAPVQSLSRSSI